MRRPSRSAALLGLVVVLLATIPVLVPLLVTSTHGAQGAAPVELAAAPAAPVPAAASGRPAGIRPAGALAAWTASPTPAAPPPTAAPTTAPPTSAPASAPTSAAGPTAPAPATPTSGPPAPTPVATSPGPAVLAAAPDLTVTSVTWSPAAPEAGQPVVFSAVVRNSGTDATPDATHGVAFSVDGTKVTWSAGSTAPLAPGEERTYTADGGEAGNAWTAATGEHTVQAFADDVDRIPESDETDNTATATVTVR